MGFRFRKSKQIIPGLRVGLGVSKNGISPSVSVGPRGAKIGIGKRGVNLGASIPGSGLSYNKQFGWGKIKPMANEIRDTEAAPKRFPVFKTIIGVVAVILAVKACSPADNTVAVDRSYDPATVQVVEPENQFAHLSDEEFLALAEQVEGSQVAPYQMDVPQVDPQAEIERSVFEGRMDQQGNRLETQVEHRQHTQSDLFYNFYQPLSNRTHEGWAGVEAALQDRYDAQVSEQARVAAARQQEETRRAEYAAQVALVEAQQRAQQYERERQAAAQEQARQRALFVQQSQPQPRQVTYYSASTNQPVAAPVSNERERVSGYATGYGEISEVNGRPRTNLVSGYTRADGTVVAPYYRSTPRR